MQQQSSDFRKIHLKDAYWDTVISLIQDTMIPYQWEVLHDHLEGVEPSHVIHNFQIAAGLRQGEFGGMVFQDSDLSKWLEAASYSLQLRPDAELESRMDEAIALLGQAQRPDGYLDTYYMIKEPDKRWTNLLHGHELYCAGHMIEAGVAHYLATGKKTLLDIVCKFADYIDTVFGREPGKLRGYPGHPEVELALVRLYDVTGEHKYLRLAEYFVNERGTAPQYFDAEWKRNGHFNIWLNTTTETPQAAYGEVDYREYAQYHKPVREQKKATGHAVRALYLYTGMAEVAARTGDETLKQACRTLWDDVVNAQLYITGGVGSTAVGEAFTFDYDLPNDTVYAETCASVALIFFARAMFQMEADSTYFDVAEKALYNLLPASMQRDGKHYYYTNPMEVWPQRNTHSQIVDHIKPVRQKWFACACCPPNLARTIMSLGRYLFATSEDKLYVNLFVGCDADVTVGDLPVRLTLQSRYPQDGNITLTVHPQQKSAFTLCVRKPGWCRQAALLVNGQPAAAQLVNGYWQVEREWADGDVVTVQLEMNSTFMQANPKVRADTGKLCLMRGPLVYCLEQMDNGENLAALRALPNQPVEEIALPGLPDGTVALQFAGMRTKAAEDALYTPYQPAEEPVTMVAVPYANWGNRVPGEMMVWMRA